MTRLTFQIAQQQFVNVLKLIGMQIVVSNNVEEVIDREQASVGGGCGIP